MRELEDYIRLLSPKKEDKAILIYGSKYRLWLQGSYLGTAMWMRDEDLGDTFQNHVVVNGELFQLVYLADTWELIIRRRRQTR